MAINDLQHTRLRDQSVVGVVCKWLRPADLFRQRLRTPFRIVVSPQPQDGYAEESQTIASIAILCNAKERAPLAQKCPSVSTKRKCRRDRLAPRMP